MVAAGGTRANRILEGECGREASCFNNAHRLKEILFGLSGESDNDVGTDRGVRNTVTNTVEDSEKLL